MIDASFDPIDRSDLGLNEPSRIDQPRMGARLARAGAATVAGNVWAVIVGVATLPIVLRGLGPTQFGLWVLLQTLSAVSGWLSLADLGLRAAVVREIAHALGRGDGDTANRIAGTALRLYCALALAVGLVVFVLGRSLLGSWFATPDGLTATFRLATVWFAMQISAEIGLVAAQTQIEGNQRVDIARAIHALRATAVAASIAVAASTSGSLSSVAGASAGATCLAAVSAWFVASRVTTTRPLGWSRPLAMQLVRYGAQIGAINATGVLHRTMDRIVVSAIYGPAAVVLVEIATQIANGASIALSVAHPLTATAAWVDGRGDEAGLRRLLLRGTKLTLLATLPAAAIGTFLAPNIVEVWVGTRWSDAASLAALAVAGAVLAAPSQPSSLVLQATGRARVVLIPAVAAVGANLALSIVLARRHGVAGVFWATIATAVALGFPIVTRALRHTGTAVEALFRTAFAPTIVPAAAAFGGALLGRMIDGGLTGLVAGCAASLTAWSLTTIACGLGRDDRASLLAAFSPRGRAIPR